MTDPLNIAIPLANVDSSLPLLPEKDYVLQVVESSVQPNKAGTGRNWVLKLGTTAKETAVDGRDVNPNFPLFQQIALQPSEKSTDPSAFVRGICQAVDAIMHTDKTNRPDFSGEVVNGAVGKLVLASVVIDQYQGNDNNKIKRLKQFNG